MAKNNTVIESNKKIHHIQFCTALLMFVCLIGQVVALYLDINNIFYVLVYIFIFIFGIVSGFILGIKMIK